MNKRIAIFASVVIAYLTFATVQVYALAGVGQEFFCLVNDPTGGLFYTGDSNDLEGQTFTPSSSVTIGAVKLNTYRSSVSDGIAMPIYITDTFGGAAPDMTSVLGTETFDTSNLPIYDTGTLTNNTFDCDPDVDSGQVVVFNPPVALSGSTTYAIVVEGVVGATGDDFKAPYTLGDPYLLGVHYECDVPVACTRNTPATWDTNGDDIGFALFDNIVDAEIPTGSLDDRLVTLLQDHGLDDTGGKLLVFFFLSVVMLIGLALVRTHPILIMSMLGIWGAVGAGVVLLPPTLVLLGVVLVFFGILVGAILLLRSQTG